MRWLSLAVRLARRDLRGGFGGFWVLVVGIALGVAATAEAWSKAEGRNGFDAYRRDSWAHIVVSGPAATELMPELTDVDLRDKSLPELTVAQTRLLHVDTIIVRTDLAGVPGYELFCDIASRAYVLEGIQHLARGYRFSTH